MQVVILNYLNSMPYTENFAIVENLPQTAWIGYSMQSTSSFYMEKYTGLVILVVCVHKEPDGECAIFRLGSRKNAEP
jgi:hypothetical protein